MNEEESNYLNTLKMYADQQETENSQLRKGMATMFNKEQDANLVKWQLDIQEELERIEHLLRRHVPKVDSQGNEYFEEAKESEKLFNETGVQEILNILAWYLNKNIILSNFDDKEINLRMKQFSYTLTDFIFINYEKFGLDTPDKMKHYPMVVLNIVNTVEASYHRAMFGGERTSLRTARTVHQTENPLGLSMPNFQPQSQNKFNLLKPTTWIKR